jgi:uncharacterized protein (TIGR01777 family)
VTPRARFSWSSVLEHPIADVFSWHTRRGAFQRLNDPWRPVVVTSSQDTIAQGSDVVIRVPFWGSLGIPWHLRHTYLNPPYEFIDQQIRGPFREWKHTHRFLEIDPCKTTMLDEIEYQMPLGTSVATPLLRHQLERLFRFRHAMLQSDLDLHARWRTKPRKRIVLAGASGFVGSALVAFLTTAGHDVIQLVRRAPQSSYERSWDPAKGILDPALFDGAQVVINLSGESLVEGRWTEKRKREIEQSRVETTRLLSSALATHAQNIEVLISASGVGCYGDTGDQSATEDTPLGTGFLSEVCQRWEAQTKPLEAVGVRVVLLRLGTVLNAQGGALKKMLPFFVVGLGGPLGNGQQWMSWIAMQDLLGIVEHAIYSATLRGPVNCVSPRSVRNYEFTRALGRVVRRPAFLPAPRAALRMAFGEMAEAVLLAGSRVSPSALERDGYRFVLEDIEQALRFECGHVAHVQGA